jgi:hypothetical protein
MEFLLLILFPSLGIQLAEYSNLPEEIVTHARELSSESRVVPVPVKLSIIICSTLSQCIEPRTLLGRTVD